MMYDYVEIVKKMLQNYFKTKYVAGADDARTSSTPQAVAYHRHANLVATFLIMSYFFIFIKGFGVIFRL